MVGGACRGFELDCLPPMMTKSTSFTGLGKSVGNSSARVLFSKLWRMAMLKDNFSEVVVRECSNFSCTKLVNRLVD